MAENAAQQTTIKLLLCCTGSVASIKLEQVLQLFLQSSGIKYDISVALTEHAKHFVNVQNLKLQFPQVDFYSDADEWSTWQKMGDQVKHIELRRNADICLVCPLSANTLGKIANGLCDNLVTCIIRAWDETKPFIVAPAMNTMMWNQKITGKQLKEIGINLNAIVIDTVEKKLACGDFGKGAMAAPETIMQVVHNVAQNVLQAKQ